MDPSRTISSVAGCHFKADETMVSLITILLDLGIDRLWTIDDLCVEQWISFGHLQCNVIDLDLGCIHITDMPGTNVSLGDGFTMYFLDQALPSPRNQALCAIGEDFFWKGDVVVLKNRHGEYNRSRFQLD